MKLYYLASPYSHTDEEIRNERYRQACKALVELRSEKGIIVYSPIVQEHPTYKLLRRSGEFVEYQDLNMEMIRRCDALIICNFPGLPRSVGVCTEVQHAIDMYKDLFLLSLCEVCSHIKLEEILAERALALFLPSAFNHRARK